jgi:circadian clock protein KaiC
MANKGRKTKISASPALPKSFSGIQGLDEITGGGLPKGRPTLICGSAGSGKTLFAMEFLVRGAVEYNESGVFVSFEESAEELAKNVKSLGFDLDDLEKKKLIAVDYVYIEKSEIEETGEYDLEGLFVRLDHAIRSIGAKRVVLDTIEALFAGLPNPNILRAELRRLFRWLKEKGVTAIITGERGEGSLTRHGIEEYVSDCVIMLDHRVTEQVSTRRLRIVKYRGSMHGSNEYPFIIGEKGFSILPITSLGLDHVVTSERISTGIPRLDAMMGDRGYYVGSSILVSGTAGTGKSSIAAVFVDGACAGGKKCLYFSFEESQSQIMRNMRSIGIDLSKWVKKGMLRFHTSRPTSVGLELHLVTMFREIEEFSPDVVVIDPITNFVSVGSSLDVKAMITRLIDYLKTKRVTTLFTNLSHAGGPLEQTDVAVSSLMDTWLLIRDIETNGERNRGINVLKSRGMAHSHKISEFLISDHGLELRDIYAGPGGFLMGTARTEKEVREKTAAELRHTEVGRKRQAHSKKRKALEANISELQAEIAAGEKEIKSVISEDARQRAGIERERPELGSFRKADSASVRKTKARKGKRGSR